ncbi:zinc finger protein 879-like isoform X25 [Ostrinia nubilalis]|uniref:zinc finger protein 879-like isoform X25 n=1 Tax=Ostrinia nubilalis TaxID=29057 RepID=UPI0030822730
MAAKTTDWRPGPTVCRCCLSEGCYKDISTEYFWMGKREVYSEMLSETFSLSIAYSTSGGPNSNSRLICEPCISRLRDASDFKRQVQECEKTFMQYLDPGTERLSDFETAESRIEVTLESLETEVKVEQVKTEKDESDGDDFGDRTDFPDLDDDDDDLDDQPLTRLATRVPKKESVDTEADSKPEKRKATTKAKTSPAKKAKTKKEVVKATTSKAAKPTEKKKKGSANADSGANVSVVKRVVRKLKENVSERQMRRRRRANNELPEESEKRIGKTMMRRNAMTLLECSTAWAFRWFHGVFYCSYCDEKFVDMVPLKEHVFASHSNEPPTKRLFAKITENNMLKIDIGNLSCRLCDNYVEGFDALKNHLLSCHGRALNSDYSDGVLPFKLGNGGIQCQICYAQFESFPKVNQHMNTHYPNYVCDECGKPFSSKSRFRRHVQSHEVGKFPCGECEIIFLTRVERMCHKLKIHKKGYRYSCPRCSESFTSYYARGKHLVDRHGQQKIDYDCPACGKTFETGSKRAAHFRLTHGNIGKKFDCNECTSTFNSKSKLQRHLLTHMKKETQK